MGGAGLTTGAGMGGAGLICSAAMGTVSRHVSRRRLRRLGLAAAGFVASLAFAPGTARADDEKKGGSASFDSKKGGSAKGKGGGFELPDMVYGGNAISVLMPVQVGFTSYEPRVRIGLQYDYQMYKAHWVYGGAAALLDNGDFQNFRVDCDGNFPCGRGTVAGFDINGGYAHKWYLEDRPWLVPIARGGLGFQWWRYPALGGSRQQDRVRTWQLDLRGGGGIRVFLLRDLAVGFDLNLHLGFQRHKDEPIAAGEEKSSSFALGMEILPLIVEYRF